MMSNKNPIIKFKFPIVIQIRWEMELSRQVSAIHDNPNVAKITQLLNRLGKGIWSYYWHFLSNFNNARKPLVKQAASGGLCHVSESAMHMATCRQHNTNFLEYAAWCKIYTPVYMDDLCIHSDKLLKVSLH